MSEFPHTYNWLASKFEKVIDVHQQFGKELQKAGPLNDKTGQLIKLAGAAAFNSKGAVRSHCRQALEADATPDEIYHTLILLVSTIGFPRVASALSWAKNVIEKED